MPSVDHSEFRPLPPGDGVLVRRQYEAVEDLIGNIDRSCSDGPMGRETTVTRVSRLDALNSLRDTDVEIPIFSQGSLGDRIEEDAGE